MMKCHAFGASVALVVALGCGASSGSNGKATTDHGGAGNRDSEEGGASAGNGNAGGYLNTGGVAGSQRDAGSVLDTGTAKRMSAGGAAGVGCSGASCELVVHNGLDAHGGCEGGACRGDGDGGWFDAGDSGADHDRFCATAPWLNSPVAFTSANGRTTIPAGAYTLTYVGGAQIHDASEGYEVTAHYMSGSIEAGHHLFNGASPETSSTSVWLDDTGTIGSLPMVSDVEQRNAGHTWSLQHAGGPLFITYYDDYYGDNQGPGTRLCIEALRCVADASATVVVPGAVPWTDSGIDVVAGTRVLISASGSIQYGSLAAQVTDPNGGNYDGQTSFADDVLPPPTITVSLIGKTGGTTDVGTGVPVPEGITGDGPGFIGKSYDRTIPLSGRLYLGFNDQVVAFDGNSGSFTVTVTKKGTCPP